MPGLSKVLRRETKQLIKLGDLMEIDLLLIQSSICYNSNFLAICNKMWIYVDLMVIFRQNTKMQFAVIAPGNFWISWKKYEQSVKNNDRVAFQK